MKQTDENILSRGREVGVVSSSGVLNRHCHAVIALAALVEVVVLEAGRGSVLSARLRE